MSMIDEWSGLADLLANLIEKYTSDLDIEDMSDVVVKIDTENENNKTEETEIE